MNTDMDVKINMAAQMSNAELADAISVAHEKERWTYAGSEKEKMWHNHLASLLEIQRCRAAACSVDNSNPTGHILRSNNCAPGCSMSE